jgi:hypothetical protein
MRKRKRKETNKKKPHQAIESQRRAKNKITWRRQVSDPLGKGNGSTHPRQNHPQEKSANHQSKARIPQGAPLAHMQAPPEPKHTPPEPMQQCNTRMQQGAKTYSLCPVRLDRPHQAVRPPTTHLTAWGAVRPPHVTGRTPNNSKNARTNWNTFQKLPGAQNMHKLFPLVDNAWIKAKCEKVQHIASQIYKIHHKVLHMSKWAS